MNFRRDPRRRRRSPTPDEPLVDVVPLHLRPKKLNFWDQRPSGYENMTADQVKATGMFLLPCHLLKGTGSFSEPLPTLGIGYNNAIENYIQPETNAGRNTKRLYVGGLPEEVEEDVLVNFINEEYEKKGLDKAPGKPCLAASMNKDKKSGFVELRTADETTMALQLDGCEYKGEILKIRRPKDYKPGAQDPHYVPGQISSVVQDTMFKVFIGGLPTYVSDEQVMDLLKAFGELKSFSLVKDSATGISKGFAFCEFLLPEITDIACEGLHGLEVGDKKLIVQRASVGASKLPMIDGALPGAGLGRAILPIEILGANGLKPAEPTTILVLLNMFQPEDLEEDEDYDFILDDIRKECELFGTVVEVHVPRPNDDKEIYVAGVGKVFVKFESKFDCAKAQRALAGRKYMGNTVLGTFFDETKYEARVF